MLEPGEVSFQELKQQVNTLKINVMTIRHKYDNFSLYQSPAGYCYLPTEGYCSHTTIDKKISLSSLCMSAQMPVTHVTW